MCKSNRDIKMVALVISEYSCCGCIVKECQVDVFSSTVSTCDGLSMHAEMVSRIHLFICLPLQGSLGHLGHSTIHFSLPPFKAVQDYDSYSVCINYFKIL